MSETYSTQETGVTPDTLAIRRKMALALMQQGMSAEPVKAWTQGAARALQGALGGYQLYQAGEQERASRADAIAQALKAFGPTASLAPTNLAPNASPVASPGENTPYGDNVVTANNGESFPMPPRNPLAGLNPEFRTKFADLRSAAADQGVNFDAPTGGIGGIRTPEQQASLYAQGRTSPGPVVTGTLDSNHLRGQAFDVVPRGSSPDAVGKIVSALIKDDPRFAGMRSGATFSNLYDPLHVELNKPQGDTAPYQVAGPAMAPPNSQPASSVPPSAPPSAPQPMGNNSAAIAALLNPWTPPALQGALAGQLSPSYGFQTLPDGTIVRTNPKTGQVEPVYQGPTKNTFGKIGQTRDGQDIYGIINTEKGTAVPVQVPGTATAPGAPDTAGLTGEEFLKSLNDPGRADLIKGMVEGRMAPATMGRYGTQAVQSLLKDAARYEPGFDMTKWGARAATAKDFASGQAAKNVTSLNTVIGHLGDLAEKADALGNSSFTPYNEYVKNPLANVTGSPEVKNFNLARNAVADEMAKVFRGSGLSDAETRQWKENLSAANSPAQLRGAIQTAIGLMESRLNAMNEQRNKGMGTQTEPQELLTEASRTKLEKVRKWANGDAAASQGTERKSIGGKNYYKQNGQWFEE